MFEQHRQLIEELNPIAIVGQLSAVTGLTLIAEAFPAPVGSMCRVDTRGGRRLYAQVVGFRSGGAVLMPLQECYGAAPGDRVASEPGLQRVAVGPALLGRVIDGLGRPIDRRSRIHPHHFYPVYRPAPPALSRTPIDQPLAIGVRSMDAVLTVGRGQRIGIFAGTGVGKSVLLGMISRFTEADVVVVGLVGERGREVQDFIQRDLGPQGLAKSVVVVSTSDESPVLRLRACFVATAVAEYFRDQNRQVLLLVDSLTRMAMAQRQIGLAAGEPPATKGYTPSVFAVLPQLLERSGKVGGGSITGFYAVLVEGDDIAEPISDAVRGILDGHVWLDRAMAGRGHYPAVDVLNSISRLMVDIVDGEHHDAARRVRRVLGTWRDIEDLVNIGAYAPGSNPEFDIAMQMKPRIDAFLRQDMGEKANFGQSRAALIELGRQIATLERTRLEAAPRV